jgi:acetyl/propionyl-CoA carboxylase alpha subunit
MKGLIQGYHAAPEADKAFNPDVYIEKFIINPSHEFQIFADEHGGWCISGARLLHSATKPKIVEVPSRS